jgi:hypothetical protein
MRLDGAPPLAGRAHLAAERKHDAAGGLGDAGGRLGVGRVEGEHLFLGGGEFERGDGKGVFGALERGLEAVSGVVKKGFGGE